MIGPNYSGNEISGDARPSGSKYKTVHSPPVHASPLSGGSRISPKRVRLRDLSTASSSCKIRGKKTRDARRLSEANYFTHAQTPKWSSRRLKSGIFLTQQYYIISLGNRDSYVESQNA